MQISRLINKAKNIDIIDIYRPITCSSCG